VALGVFAADPAATILADTGLDAAIVTDCIANHEIADRTGPDVRRHALVGARNDLGLSGPEGRRE
jgi:hypothetical protein